MLLKRIIKILKYLVITLTILFVLIVAGVNLPFSQRIISEKANRLFRKKDLPVQVDRIELLISGRIGLKRVQILNNNGDTIVFAEKIGISARIFPLIFRKVKVKIVTIHNAVVNITADSVTGAPDLVSLFSTGDKPPEPATEKTPGKKWEINVRNLDLKNIRLTYSDAFHGIRIDQSVGSLSVGFDDFSLIRQQIYASFVGMEKVRGSVALNTSQTSGDVNKSPPAWKFKLRKSDLSDIRFSLHQPDKNKRFEFSLSGGVISEAGFDMAGPGISVDRLLLDEPGILLFSSPAQARLETASEDTTGTDFPGLLNISGDNIKISNGYFETNTYNTRSATDTEDPSFKVSSVNLSLKDIRLNQRESGFSIDRFSFAMGNGFKLDKGEIVFSSDSSPKSMMEAKLRTGSGKIHLRIEARDELAALISSYNNVHFSLNIDDTEISARDISPFLPQLKDRSSPKALENFKIGINCNVTGTTGLLEIRNLGLNFGSGITFSASGQLSNISDMAAASCSIDFGSGAVTRSNLIELIDLTGSFLNLPDFEPLTLQGTINGRLMTPDFLLALQSLSGNISMEGSIDLPEKSYALKTSYSGVELGRLAGIKDLEMVSGSIDITGKEFIPGSMNVRASLAVDSAGYRGYDYHGLKAELEGDHGLYKFGLNSSDTSFKLNLNGTFGLNDSLKTGQVGGMFELDAGKLNLFKDISIRCDLEGNIYQARNDLKASVNLKNLVLSTDNGTEDLENLSLSFQSTDTVITGMVESDFLKAAFNIAGSTGDLQQVFKEGRLRIASVMDSSAQNRIPYISALPQTSLSIESEYDPILGILLSDSIFSYHKVRAEIIKDTSGSARADVLIDRFSFGAASGFGTSIHIGTLPDKSLITLIADSIRYGKLKLAGMQADISTAGDSAVYRFKAGDIAGKPLYDMSGVATKSEDQVRLNSTQPQWILNGFSWNVSPGAFLVLDPAHKDFTIDLHWSNDQRSVDLSGMKSEKLMLELKKVGISTLLIPAMNAYGYDGELTGTIEYKGNKKTEFDIQMDINQMKMGEVKLGDLNITGTYLSDTTGKAESDIRVVMNDTSRINFALLYGKEEGQKNISTDFSGIPLKPFESFASKYISGLQGEISGEVSVTTEGDKPLLNGEIQISNIGLRVVPLNALFYIPDEVIKLENSNLVFSQFTVLDSLKKRLSLNGTIDLNDPTDIRADLQVTSDLLQVMNTTERDNPAFNGSVFVNSKIRISGPLQKPDIEGNIVLAEGTVINYQYAEDLSVSETQKVIKFAGLTQDQSSGPAEQISVNPLSKSPDIEASIEIDPRSLFNFQISRGFDIGVSIRGGGFLTYSLMPNGVMDLTGTYEINEGSSELKIPGWPRKDFIITPGSFLKWDGKVDDPDLQVETTSKVKGSYVNPVDGKSREVNFLVNMKLAGRLSQLEIIFDVRSEDQYITSVFNSLSKDERMRQAINLLIFGSIELPNLASSSDYMTQQINQFWESQLNSITKSAIKSVDLSFGIDTYTGASETGAEQTYTSLSYQVKKDMFKDRGSVLVSGHMNDNSPASQQSNSVIENFIFEYALDTNRIKYLKIYRQQNYEDLLEGEVTKSGVGFIYRKNYDKLSDIWRRQKRTKKK